MLHVTCFLCAGLTNLPPSTHTHTATASVDNTVRVWDLRQRQCTYMLPAHANAITEARYSASGEQVRVCACISCVCVCVCV